MINRVGSTQKHICCGLHTQSIMQTTEMKITSITIRFGTHACSHELVNRFFQFSQGLSNIIRQI